MLTIVSFLLAVGRGAHVRAGACGSCRVIDALHVCDSRVEPCVFDAF